MIYTICKLSLLISSLTFVQSLECKYGGEHSVVTSTTYGTISGCSIPYMTPFYPDRRVNMWLGIPYAKRPEDFKREYSGTSNRKDWQKKYRFMKPEEPGPFQQSPYDATRYRDACPQMLWYVRETIPDFSKMSEDCLYLNIFAPNFTKNEDNMNTYPVMVFIHGGGFTMGTAEQWPAIMIAERNIVVVTMNYRLGALGFLSTGDVRTPGNYGLWDQYLALRYIKRNIRFFKGNPQQITLVGHSAGAASVGLHVLSDYSHATDRDRTRSLFHKAVYMSGSDLNNWAVIKEKWQAREYAFELAQAVGCPTSSNELMISCLQVDRGADEIVNASAYIRVRDKRMGNPWAPVIDGLVLHSTDAYVKDDPLTLRTQKQFPYMRVMGGIVKDEGSWFIPNLPSLPRGVYKNEFQNIIREFLEDQGSDNILDTMQAIEFEYTYWPQQDNETMRRQMLTDMMSDYMFGTGVYNVIKSHAAAKNKTFAYVFNYKSYNDYLPTWRGIAHGQELQYLFGFPYFNETYTSFFKVYPRQRYTYGDNETAELMISLFGNFTARDFPTVRGEKGFKGVHWEEYNIRNHPSLVIRNQSHSYITKNYRQSYYAFWMEYYRKLSGLSRANKGETKVEYKPDTTYIIATYCLVAVIGLLLIIFIGLLIRMCAKRRQDEFTENWSGKVYFDNHPSSVTF